MEPDEKCWGKSAKAVVFIYNILLLGIVGVFCILIPVCSYWPKWKDLPIIGSCVFIFLGMSIATHVINAKDMDAEEAGCTEEEGCPVLPFIIQFLVAAITIPASILINLIENTGLRFVLVVLSLSLGLQLQYGWFWRKRYYWFFWFIVGSFPSLVWIICLLF